MTDIKRVGIDLAKTKFHVAAVDEAARMVKRKRFCMTWRHINNDSTLTSAFINRLLHQAETVKIEGRIFRMKDKIDST